MFSDTISSRLLGILYISSSNLGLVEWLSLLQINVQSRSLIDVQSKLIFCVRFVLSLCFLEFSVGVRTFVIGLNQIASVFFCSSQDESNLHVSSIIFIDT